MKKAFFFIAFLFAAANSFAQTSTYVSGYTNSNGTYVQGYYRTTPMSILTRDLMEQNQPIVIMLHHQLILHQPILHQCIQVQEVVSITIIVMAIKVISVDNST
jgi:hypothetical protein